MRYSLFPLLDYKLQEDSSAFFFLTTLNTEPTILPIDQTAVQ